MATEASGTHPIGMHSCYDCIYLNHYFSGIIKFATEVSLFKVDDFVKFNELFQTQYNLMNSHLIMQLNLMPMRRIELHMEVWTECEIVFDQKI